MDTLTIEDVQAAVALTARVTVRELKGLRRYASISRARAVAMYLARELTGTSYPKIGQRFGGKDHATVIHACRRVAGDPELLARAAAVRSILTPPQPPALIAASRQPE